MNINLRDTSSNSMSPQARGSAAPQRLESRSTFAAILENTGPTELTALAFGELDEFLRLYDTLLMLVRVGAADVELLAGLNVTAIRDDANVPVEPISKTADIVNDEGEPTNTGVQSRPVETNVRVIQLLAEGRHCVVPLRKRITAESLNPNRVSVGRAPNKDIVLRHSSVSKFHAWFEVDESGSFFVTDAGSKNATWLNGVPIVAPLAPVGPGDSLRFGAVDATLCSPRALWRVLATAKRRAG
jgi:pSer/pThr/pTyr-binding forkhead associated (FHA) protein